VRGHAHVEELVEPEPEYCLGLFVEPALSELCDEEVELAEVADDAKKHLPEEPAVARAEAGLFLRIMEEFVGEFFAAYLPRDAPPGIACSSNCTDR